MSFDAAVGSPSNKEFVLIGNPVAHSLSPAMHNRLYEELGKTKWPFSSWHYDAVYCENDEEAIDQINYVRTGRYRGMNITMPFKRLALQQADYADCSADVAGGANVLVRNEDYKLCAYNTDGRGAIGAIERVSEDPVAGKSILVCGTGPTSVAIAAAGVEASADRVYLVSRESAKAQSAVTRALASLEPRARKVLFPASYDEVEGILGGLDVVIDATPRGMKPDDEPVVDVDCLHEGQIVMDTVYGHGPTRLLEGARAHGALGMDGLEMLVEQAALSVEIWADEMALPVEVDRSIMRTAALHHSK